MAGSSEKDKEKQAIVIGIDDSEQSMYALNWALDHFFPSPIFKLVLVHSRPSVSSVVGLGGPGTSILSLLRVRTFSLIQLRTPCLLYAGAPEIMPIVDSDLRRIAARIVETARQNCFNKSVIHFILFSISFG